MDAHGFPPIIDGHNDALLNLHRAERDMLARSSVGHVDLPRAVEGGLAGGFFAVFVPPLDSSPEDLLITSNGYSVREAPPLDSTYALQTTLAMIARLFRVEAQSNGRLRVVQSASDLELCIRDGIFAAILHLEGAEAIDPELDTLEVLYRAGLRSIGPVWSRANVFGYGVPFRFPASPDSGPGLTEAGRRLVRACNRLGILVDLSHLNERGFWDVAELSDAPLVATHSAAHAICPVSRNLTDAQLEAIRASGGVVGMNFEVSVLRPDGYDEPDTPLEVLVRQVDYLVEKLGIDGVAFGSDFDGATMPRAIGDVAGLPHLMEALQAGGYRGDDLAKLAYRNWLRVLKQTWR